MVTTSTFRQGTAGRLEVHVLAFNELPVPQSIGLPTVEIVYIDPTSLSMATALAPFPMYELEPGRYYFDWKVPIDQPLLVHQVIYRAQIDDDDVIGEDIFTVLPLTPQCLFTPTCLTVIKGRCGCRR